MGDAPIFSEYMYLSIEERRRFANNPIADLAPARPAPPPPPLPTILPSKPTCCAICLEVDFNPRQRFGRRCRHTFHVACLRAFRAHGGSALCPMCRTADA